MGHVVCIKGISSHFKRWPGFSPPGTPVTHPLVHTPPLKNLAQLPPLQPFHSVCVPAHIWEKQHNRYVVVLLSRHGELRAVPCSWRCRGSDHQWPHPPPTRGVSRAAHLINEHRTYRSPAMIFHQVFLVPCYVFFCCHGYSLWLGGRISERLDVIRQRSWVFVLDQDLNNLYV